MSGKIAQAGALLAGTSIVSFFAVADLLTILSKESIDKLDTSPEAPNPLAKYVLGDNVAFATALIGILALLVPLLVGASFFSRTPEQMTMYPKLTMVATGCGALMIVPIITLLIVFPTKSLQVLVDQRDAAELSGASPEDLEAANKQITLLRSSGVVALSQGVLLYLGILTFGFILYKHQVGGQVSKLAKIAFTGLICLFTGTFSLATLVVTGLSGSFFLKDDEGFGFDYNENGTPDDTSDDTLTSMALAFLMVTGVAGLLYSLCGFATMAMQSMGLETGAKVVMRLQLAFSMLAALSLFIFILGTGAIGEDRVTGEVVSAIPSIFVQLFVFHAFANFDSPEQDSRVASGMAY